MPLWDCYIAELRLTGTFPDSHLGERKHTEEVLVAMVGNVVFAPHN